MPYILHAKRDAIADWFADTEALDLAIDDYNQTHFVRNTYTHYPSMVSTLQIFDSRDDAFAALTDPIDWRKTHTVTYLPTTTDRAAWRLREMRRFRQWDDEDGQTYADAPGLNYRHLTRAYGSLPSTDHEDVIASVPDWYHPYVNTHFLHISVKNPGLVAYTPDDEAGYNDRQVRTKPGAYLKKFAPQLSPDVVAQWIAEVKAQFDAYAITVTADPDEIETVYINGPRSCMSHSVESEYRSSTHPVRVYGNCPEIRLAYFGPKTQAAGRALVRDDTKKYGRCYGDIATMRALLVQAGYTDGGLGALKGCRIRAIEEGGSYWVMPYIDGIQGASYSGGDYIHLDNRGPIATQETNGVATQDEDDDEEENHCSRCERIIDADETLCQDCYDLEFHCDACEETFFSDDIRRHDGEQHTYCHECWTELTIECALCDRQWVEMDVYTTGERAERLALRVHRLCDVCAADTQGCANDDCRGHEVTNPTYKSDALACEPTHLITGYFDRSLDRCPDCQTVVRCEKTAPLVFVDAVSAADAMIEAIATEPQPRYFRLRGYETSSQPHTLWRWHPIFGTSYLDLHQTNYEASRFDPDTLAGRVFEEITEAQALEMAHAHGRLASYLRLDHRIPAPVQAPTTAASEEMAF